MLKKPKLIFRLGYVPLSRGHVANIFFAISYQDPRWLRASAEDDILGCEVPSGIGIISDEVPSLNSLHDDVIKLRGTDRLADHAYQVIVDVNDAPAACTRIMCALGEWGRLATIWGTDIYQEDPEEPLAPFSFEPYSIEQFIIP